VVLLFQRSADIPAKVEEGSAELGVVGLERFYEERKEDGDGILIVEDMGYSRCDLVVAVPDGWIDVSALADLADLSVELRERGRELRVATEYPRLVQRFLYSKGLNYFTLVESSGATEAAPTMGYADIIADVTETGITLRDNRLKTIADGTILKSQACLIGNRRLLKQDPCCLETTRFILELVEARLRATNYYSVTANIRGESPEAVVEHLRRYPEVAGIQGPTISKVYSKLSQEQDWYAVTVVVEMDRMMEAVETMRQMGGSGITVFSANYVFEGQSQIYKRLVRQLEGEL
jgi:ATP phosphoribosyltransferase